MSCYSYVVEQMSDVEAGMKNCLDELSFHNILAVLGVGHYWIAGKDRVSCFLFCSSGYAKC